MKSLGRDMMSMIQVQQVCTMPMKLPVPGPLTGMMITMITVSAELCLYCTGLVLIRTRASPAKKMSHIINGCGTNRNVKQRWLLPTAWEQPKSSTELHLFPKTLGVFRSPFLEPATSIISQCNGIFTDHFIFRYFSCEIGQFQST